MKIIAVAYIGKGSVWVDNAYGSNMIFEQNETYRLPENLANKLLQHADCFVVSDDTGGAAGSYDDTALKKRLTAIETASQSQEANINALQQAITENTQGDTTNKTELITELEEVKTQVEANTAGLSGVKTQVEANRADIQTLKDTSSGSGGLDEIETAIQELNNKYDTLTEDISDPSFYEKTAVYPAVYGNSAHLDDLKTSGFYLRQMNTTPEYGFPDTVNANGSGVILAVFNKPSNAYAGIQQFFTYTGERWHRAYYKNAWTAWEKF